MPLAGAYEPSPWEPVAEQVRLYEETGGEEDRTLEGQPCVILTTRGRKTGKIRKTRSCGSSTTARTPSAPRWAEPRSIPSGT